jgi:hypothetical protein
MNSAVVFAMGALVAHHFTQKALMKKENFMNFGMGKKMMSNYLGNAISHTDKMPFQDENTLDLVDLKKYEELKYSAKFEQRIPAFDVYWKPNRVPGVTMGQDIRFLTKRQ